MKILNIKTTVRSGPVSLPTVFPPKMLKETHTIKNSLQPSNTELLPIAALISKIPCEICEAFYWWVGNVSADTAALPWIGRLMTEIPLQVSSYYCIHTENIKKLN